MSVIAQDNVRRAREAMVFALREVCRNTEAARWRAAFDLSVDPGAIGALLEEAAAGLQLARERLIDTERVIDAAGSLAAEWAEDHENGANDDRGGAA